MGPRDEQQQNEQHHDGAKSCDTPTDGQAIAGTPIPFPGAADHAVEQAGNTSPRASSAEYSDDFIDSRSGSSGSASFTSSRKTPLHRRIAKAFNRSHGRSFQLPLIKKRFEPHVPQIIRSLDGYPQGYGKVAAFEACDPNLLIYRKFAWLHNRLLLHYQDELVQLEKELEQIDQHHFREDPERLVSRRRDDVSPEPRTKDILKNIDAKLAQYHALLLRMQKIHAIKRPTQRNQSILWHLITDTQSQTSKESEWVHLGPDLAALAHDQEYGKFNTFLEDSLNRISGDLTKRSQQLTALKYIFRSPEQKTIAGSEEIDLLSPTRLDVFLRIVLTILAAALLLLPVTILITNQPTSTSQLQQKGRTQIVTVFAFTLLFSATCSIVTKARRQEVFAATAAYCAVLVVFLGNTSNVMLPAAD